jgi:hypothetical protein
MPPSDYSRLAHSLPPSETRRARVGVKSLPAYRMQLPPSQPSPMPRGRSIVHRAPERCPERCVVCFSLRL